MRKDAHAEQVGVLTKNGCALKRQSNTTLESCVYACSRVTMNRNIPVHVTLFSHHFLLPLYCHLTNKGENIIEKILYM